MRTLKQKTDHLNEFVSELAACKTDQQRLFAFDRFERRIALFRRQPKSGVRGAPPRLSKSQRISLKQKFWAGDSIVDLQIEFGIARSTIYRIANE